jgi:cardiolipin synthase
VVPGLLGVSLNDWYVETAASITELLKTSGLRAMPPAGGAAVQVLPTGPARGGDGCLQMLLAMLFAARQRVVITTPYFVPDEALLRALRGTAARGGEVVLIVPHKVDSVLVRHASRSYYDELLAAGVRIHRYVGGLLHTKSVAVDGRLAMFGTHNVDLRSLWLNFEVSLFVYDEEFGRALGALHERYLEQCAPLDPAVWRARPWFGRLRDNVVRLFSPLL